MGTLIITCGARGAPSGGLRAQRRSRANVDRARSCVTQILRRNKYLFHVNDAQGEIKNKMRCRINQTLHW